MTGQAYFAYIKLWIAADCGHHPKAIAHKLLLAGYVNIRKWQSGAASGACCRASGQKSDG